jgi:small subunit ribosomal protein S1
MTDLKSPDAPMPETAGANPETIETSFGDILSQFEQEHPDAPSSNATVEGTVVSINPDNVVVDIGRKMEGVLGPQQLRDVAAAGVELKPGDKIMVSVRGTNSEGYFELSTIKVERPKDWTAIQKAYADKTPIAGVVVESVKGGLRVDIGVRAFMPASRSGAKDVPEMEKLLGQEIMCRVTKLDIDKEDVVVDRRAVLEEEAQKARAEAFLQLKEGDVRQGSVRSLTEFGAFVDIGGFDGLVHVSDISWNRTAKPGDLLNVGDVVQVKILKINPERRKISLGIKQLMPDPWTVAAERYQVGQRVKGTVARLTDFGAFVELEPGLDGLIHLSEMSWSKKVRKPSDLVKVGDQVEAIVLAVNPADKRIGLGLKQALGDPWEDVPKKYPRGSVVEAPITNLAKFGAFVDLGEGIEGMIHIGDISREKRLNHPNEMLKVGEVVKAQVLELDREKKRIRLGMKQLEPTPSDHYIKDHTVGQIVSGRVVEVHATAAKVELGDGVIGTCRIKKDAAAAAAAGNAQKVDVSEAMALLTARWKGGVGGKEENKDHLKPGQVRNFRITVLDAGGRRIELEIEPKPNQ